MVFLPQVPGSGAWGGMGVRPQVGVRAQSVGDPGQRGLCLLACPCPASRASGFFNLFLCDGSIPGGKDTVARKDPPTGSLLCGAQREAGQLRFRPWFCISASLCHTYLVCAMGR